jgi:hypothetical protein
MTIIVKDFDSYKIKYMSFKSSSGISKVYAAISCYNINQIVGVLGLLTLIQFHMKTPIIRTY